MALPDRLEGELSYCKQIDVGLLNAGRMGDIIRMPAERVGLAIEPDLVAAMLEEAQGPEALPLLAYALNYLWHRRGEEDTLRLCHYDALGRLGGVIRRQAEEAATSGGGSADEAVALFAAHLVNISERRAPIKREVRAVDLTETERAILDRFVAARLLTRSGEEERDTTTYRISHDAVFREWERLAARIAEDREAIRCLNDLRRAAGRWARQSNPDHLLNHRGDGLAEVHTVLARPGYATALEETPTRYLAACDAAVTAARQAVRRRRLRTGGLIGGITAAAAVAVFLVYTEWQKSAERNRPSYYTEEARKALDAKEFDLALWYALQAWPREDATGTALPPSSELFAIVTSARPELFVTQRFPLPPEDQVRWFQYSPERDMAILLLSDRILLRYGDGREGGQIKITKEGARSFMFTESLNIIDIIFDGGTVVSRNLAGSKVVETSLPFEPRSIIRNGEKSFFTDDGDHVYHVDQALPGSESHRNIHSGDFVASGGRTAHSVLFFDKTGILRIDFNNYKKLSHKLTKKLFRSIVSYSKKYYLFEKGKIYEYSNSNTLNDEYNIPNTSYLRAQQASDFIFIQELENSYLWNRFNHKIIDIDLDLNFHGYIGANAYFMALRTSDGSIRLFDLKNLKLTPFNLKIDLENNNINFSSDNKIIIVTKDAVKWIETNLNPTKELCKNLEKIETPNNLSSNPCDALNKIN